MPVSEVNHISSEIFMDESAGSRATAKNAMVPLQTGVHPNLAGGRNSISSYQSSESSHSKGGRFRNTWITAECAATTPVDSFDKPHLTGGRRGACHEGGEHDFNDMSRFRGRHLKSERRFGEACRRIVDNDIVVTITMLLTIWVLVCDDVRMMFAQKKDDPIFEVILIVSLVVFGIEVVLTSAGKSDYFMGFFFILDLASTASLVFDLPSYQAAQAEEESIATASEGKTARIGAKAARIVRIVRLVRIVKLYKILITHFEKRIDKWMGLRPGEDTQFLEDTGDHVLTVSKKESRVGKQLSHATLKSVIVLILAMLIVVPTLSASDTLLYPGSPSYGADEILEAFQAQDTETPTRDDMVRVPREYYEQSLLRYIFYHNWFSGNGECPANSKGSCPRLYYSHLFWIGVAGSEEIAVIERANASKMQEKTVQQWAANRGSSRNTLFNTGDMPASALAAMGSKWDTDCRRTLSKGQREYMMGFSLIDTEDDHRVASRVRCPSDLRAIESARFFPQLIDADTALKKHFVFYFDQRKFLQEQAAFGIGVTMSVCLSLVLAMVVFSRTANSLVLGPVESMIAKVELIRENPLAAVRMGDLEFKAEETERIIQNRRIARLGAGPIKCLHKLATCGASSKHAQPMETLILEKTLVKLGCLLALGFGEAGTSIINKNMQSAESANVNVMLKGERVCCIYGLARIQDFSVITEVLQSKVMTFVNQIAEIVHGVVVEFLGAVNKNTGDSFLLVWRSTKEDESDMGKLADMSVAAFSKILACLQASIALSAYRGHPKIQFLLGAEYSVCLNVGLHAGWAFEGAMGSEYKIDASYISPNIAITSNVEAATKHFRVPLLITEDVMELCSSGVTGVCRKIDTVFMSGRSYTTDLHCLDLDTTVLAVEKPGPEVVWNPRARYKIRQFLDSEKSAVRQDTMYAEKTLLNDESIIDMRKRYTVEFVETFKMGFKNYQEGEWHVAQVFMARACQILGSSDGPSESLLDFMSQTNFEAPANWGGARDLGPLLQGPPKSLLRPATSDFPAVQVRTASCISGERFDLMSAPSDDAGVPDVLAEWQLPNAVPHDSPGGSHVEEVPVVPTTVAEERVARDNED